MLLNNFHSGCELTINSMLNISSVHIDVVIVLVPSRTRNGRIRNCLMSLLGTRGGQTLKPHRERGGFSAGGGQDL